MTDSSIKNLILLIISFNCLNCHSGNPANYLKANLQRDTLSINNQAFIKISKDSTFKALINISGDTIIPRQEYYVRAHFLDINKDGFQDLRIFLFSNTPNDCENYFFEAQTKTFRRILRCNLDVKKIEGINLYYSYNRAGCADNNWESHLTTIENWSEKKTGEMRAKGCGDNDDGIYVYKVNEGKQKLIQKLPIVYGNDKWIFIENYWKKNYRLFHQ